MSNLPKSSFESRVTAYFIYTVMHLPYIRAIIYRDALSHWIHSKAIRERKWKSMREEERGLSEGRMNKQKRQCTLSLSVFFFHSQIQMIWFVVIHNASQCKMEFIFLQRYSGESSQHHKLVSIILTYLFLVQKSKAIKRYTRCYIIFITAMASSRLSDQVLQLHHISSQAPIPVYSHLITNGPHLFAITPLPLNHPGSNSYSVKCYVNIVSVCQIPSFCYLTCFIFI